MGLEPGSSLSPAHILVLWASAVMIGLADTFLRASDSSAFRKNVQKHIHKNVKPGM